MQICIDQCCIVTIVIIHFNYFRRLLESAVCGEFLPMCQSCPSGQSMCVHAQTVNQKLI